LTSELIKTTRDQIADLIQDPEKVSGLLDRIKIEINSLGQPNAASKSTRAMVKKNAMLITKTKTLIDGYGKELVAEYKAIPKKIDASRKRIRDQLDEWKEQYRSPLTAWEEEEKKRAKDIQKDIDFLKNADNIFRGDGTITDSKYFIEQLQIVEEFIILDSFAEFKAEAEQEKQLAIKALKVRIEEKENEEANQAELEKLRKEKEDADQIEREKRIAEQAEEKGKREAEEKANREKEKTIREKARQDQKEESERAEARRKTEDKEHQRKINQEILKALVEFSEMKEYNAKLLIREIASGKIPHVIINY